jgi:hypothetical protein
MMDRALQRSILERLSVVYPRGADVVGKAPDPEAIYAALVYLEEHGLCRSGVVRRNVGGETQVAYPGISTITAAGLDFLEEDGGIGAILRTVTVKLDAGTIRALLEEKVEALPLPAAEKSAITRHLQALSAEALKAATTDLVKSGLDHLPDALQWLRTLAGL